MKFSTKRVMLMIFASVMLFPVSLLDSSWKQESFLEQNARTLLANLDFGTASHRIKSPSIKSIAALKSFNEHYARINPLDYQSGHTFLNSIDPETNVLLVFVEGLAQQHLDNGYLPRLQQRADDNFYAENLIAPQRQTNRGLYAALCGKYPNLVSKIAKSDIISSHGVDTLCLPEILSRKGYYTLFLQSADLGFMRKDLFTRQIGYAKSTGRPAVFPARLQSIWGIDDETLYRTAIHEIKELERQNKKWFMTLLTTSTHHPFPTPFSPEGEDFKVALEFADYALDYLIDALEKNGFLENTLLLITSDEANGTGHLEGSDVSNLLADHHVPLVVLGKRLPLKKIQKGLFSQVDIPMSILDYLKIEQPLPVGGRSLFREYGHQKNIYFANVYQNFFGFLAGKNLMVLCRLNDDCNKYRLGDDALKNSRFAFEKRYQASEEDLETINGMIEVNELSQMHAKIFSESGRQYENGKNYDIVRFFNVEGKENERLRISMAVNNAGENNGNELAFHVAVNNLLSSRALRKQAVVPAGAKKELAFNFILEQKGYYSLHIVATGTNTDAWLMENMEIFLE